MSLDGISIRVIGGFLLVCMLGIRPLFAIELSSATTLPGTLLGKSIVEDMVEPQTGFTTQNEWLQFCADIERVLQGHLLDDQAWCIPDTDLVVAFLGILPEGALFIQDVRRLDSLVTRQGVNRRVPVLLPGLPDEEPSGSSYAAVYRWTRPYWLTPLLAARRQAVLSDLGFWKRRVNATALPGAAALLVPRLKLVFVTEGVPPEFVWLAEIESVFDTDAVSVDGARGLFQFMPATAARFGLKTRWPDERHHPDKAASAAARYLKVLYFEFGAWDLALAAYNGGEGLVRRIQRRYKLKNFTDLAPYLPDQTQVYVPRVLATVAVRESIDPSTLPPPTGAVAR